MPVNWASSPSITLLNTIMSAISCLLTDQENRIIKDFMEPTQQSLATTVAQLFLTSSLSRHKEWITSAIGVVCFIKDRQVRSHFIKFYDMTKRTCIWEQEIYREMKYRAPHVWFHMFEAQNEIAGIQFVDENEAKLFQDTIQFRLARFNRAQMIRNEQKLGSSGALEQEHEDPEKMPHFKKKPPPIPSISGTNADQPLHGEQAMAKSRKPKRKSKKNRKNEKTITKADISKPTGFVHVSGVQSSSEGFKMVDNYQDVDPRIHEFLKVAGLDMRNLQDPKQRREIETFVRTNNVIKTMDNRLSRMITKREAPKGPKPKPEIKIIPNVQPPSTPKAYGTGSIPRARMSMASRPQIPDMSALAAPAPPVTPTPVVQKQYGGTIKAPPPPPSPSSGAGAGPAPPPPPPPPPPPMTPLAPPAPMGGIKPASSPSTRNLIAPENGRGDLMAEIRNRGGANAAGLKKVTEKEREKSPIREEDNSLTAILKNALTSIQIANLGASSDDDDDDDEYNSGSWSDSETSC